MRNNEGSKIDVSMIMNFQRMWWKLSVVCILYVWNRIIMFFEWELFRTNILHGFNNGWGKQWQHSFFLSFVITHIHATQIFVFFFVFFSLFVESLRDSMKRCELMWLQTKWYACFDIYNIYWILSDKLWKDLPNLQTTILWN